MATDSNLSEFHWAAQYNDVDILKDDIKFCQADPNKRSSIYGATALMYAAANNCIDAINYLLDLPEVDICLKDKEGYTAADHARLAGYLKLADALNQMILEETHASSVTLSSGVATPVFDSVSSSRLSPSCSADATNFF
jgi:ankyrin repeat protein